MMSIAVCLWSVVASGCPTTEWEQAILDKHNEWRANTQPPAKDMYKLRWDSVIATNIKNWIGKCDPNWPHSDQETYRKDVGGYAYLGENLVYCAGVACDAPMADGTPGYLGKSWWDEKDTYDWATDTGTGVTSHYTQMSSSNIYAIGCAAVECPAPGPYGWNDKWWEFGCEYGERGQGYWVGTKPFEQGSGGLVEPDMSLLAKHSGICMDATVTTNAPAAVQTAAPVGVTSMPGMTSTQSPGGPVTGAPTGGVMSPSPLPAAAGGGSDSGFPWWGALLIVMSLLLCAGVLGFVVYRRQEERNVTGKVNFANFLDETKADAPLHV